MQLQCDPIHYKMWLCSCGQDLPGILCIMSCCMANRNMQRLINHDSNGSHNAGG